VEGISYAIPCFKLDGALVYFAAFSQHIGFYPPVKGDPRLEKAVAKYAGEKGNLRFPLDAPIPYALIGRIVKHRVKQNRAKQKWQGSGPSAARLDRDAKTLAALDQQFLGALDPASTPSMFGLTRSARFQYSIAFFVLLELEIDLAVAGERTEVIGVALHDLVAVGERLPELAGEKERGRALVPAFRECGLRRITSLNVAIAARSCWSCIWPTPVSMSASIASSPERDQKTQSACSA
jgi:hypothetical protein